MGADAPSRLTKAEMIDSNPDELKRIAALSGRPLQEVMQ